MKKAENSLHNELLSYERERRHWTQEEVAEQIGAADSNMVGRWERGITSPTTQYRQKLVTLFGRSASELGFVRKGEIPFWSVPFRRNMFFTGREELLQQLHTRLSSQKRAALIPPQSISGLGGVGKTQTALEYAYQYRHEYHTVAWIRADSPEVLMSDFAALADLLNLPERDQPDQQCSVQAVKRWLSAMTRWLLIFDNTDELNYLYDFLPTSSRGHMIFTTRTQMTGTLAETLAVETWDAQEGASFLLRRAKIIAMDTPAGDIIEADRQLAIDISEILGGLPLALDQAGAYIEETGCGLLNYLDVFQSHQQELLNWRGDLAVYHPQSVMTTWSLLFEKLSQTNPVAVELLSLFALLDPDAIPEELFTQETAGPGAPLASFAGNHLQLDRAIKELRKFSLVSRQPETNMLTIHRLVQAVLLDRMDDDTQRLCSERIVLAVNQMFAEASFETRAVCERFLAQAQRCARLIERWDMRFPEVTQLLHRLGSYLVLRSQITQAEHILKLALTIRAETLEPTHQLIAESLTDLGLLYFYLAKYEQAEPLMRRALTIRERALGLEDPQVAESLDNLALIYSVQKKYAEAEPLYLQALQLRKQILGNEHAKVSETLSNLGMLYFKQEKFVKAKSLFHRALTIREKNLGSDHPFVGVVLLNLAGAKRELKKYDQAEALFLKVLSMWEQAIGADESDVAYVLSGLARLYFAQSDYTRAEPLFQRARNIFEKTFGPRNSRVVERLKDLARIYSAKGEYDQAEHYYRQVIAIFEEMYGAESLKVAEMVSELAQLSAIWGNAV